MNRFIWLWDNAATLAGIATLLALLTALTIWTRLLRQSSRLNGGERSLRNIEL